MFNPFRRLTRSILDQQAYSVLIDEVVHLISDNKISRDDALFRLQRLRDLEASGEDPLPYVVGLKHLDHDDDDGHREDEVDRDEYDLECEGRGLDEEEDELAEPNERKYVIVGMEDPEDEES